MGEREGAKPPHKGPARSAGTNRGYLCSADVIVLGYVR